MKLVKLKELGIGDAFQIGEFDDDLFKVDHIERSSDPRYPDNLTYLCYCFFGPIRGRVQYYPGDYEVLKIETD